MNTAEQKAKLEEYAKGQDIAAVVAQDALDATYADDNGLGYLKDVVEHGCQSGTVSGLIYYTDTREFYDTHILEIDEILQDYEDSTGEGFRFNGRPVSNTLAWMGYEEVARKLYEELTGEAA